MSTDPLCSGVSLKSQPPSLLPFPNVPKSDHMGQEFQYFHLKKELTVTLKGTTAKWQQIYAVSQTVLGT